MRALTNFFENIALALKPVGMYLSVIAAALFFVLVLAPGGLPLTFRCLLILVSMWVLGLTLIYFCYCPGAASFLFLKWKTTSLLRRTPKGLHSFVNLFVLLLLGTLVYASILISYELVQEPVNTALSTLG